MNIKGITYLELNNSIFQINLKKGFKYIDKAGEIINNYCNDDNEVSFQMGLDGLNIMNPEKYIEIIKYSPEMLFIKYKQITTIDQALQFLKKPINILQNIMDISEISRIGWRNYFLLELKDKKYIEAIENKLMIIPSTKTILTKISHSNKNIKSNTEIEFLVNKKEPDKKAIKFNIDCFINENIHITEVINKVNNFSDYLKNDFVELVNKVLEVK